MAQSDDPAVQALRLRAVHLMSAASRAAARVEVATAQHKAAALRSGAVKGQLGKCDEWADAVTRESVTRSSEESARRVALGSARAARGATARATAIEDHVRARQVRENRLAVKQQRIRDRQAAAVEQARVRSAQTMRWAGICHAEEEAQVAWRWKLHEQKARAKRLEEAAMQREAAGATRAAVLIQERTRKIERRLVASHERGVGVHGTRFACASSMRSSTPKHSVFNVPSGCTPKRAGRLSHLAEWVPMRGMGRSKSKLIGRPLSARHPLDHCCLFGASRGAPRHAPSRVADGLQRCSLLRLVEFKAFRNAIDSVSLAPRLKPTNQQLTRVFLPVRPLLQDVQNRLVRG